MTSVKIPRICERCEIQFFINPNQQKGRFCSVTCRKSDVSLVCPECGITFTRKPHEMRRNRTGYFYCSRKCSFNHGKPMEVKFWANIEKTDSCWLWRGTLSEKGYGETRHNGQRCLAHRLSYELHKEPIPEGLGLLHSCDTPACVNPEHLKPGTQLDNMLDCSKKDRIPFGENHVHAKLSEEKVKQARALREKGATYVQLASIFNVTRQVISLAVRGQTWKRVT